MGDYANYDIHAFLNAAGMILLVFLAYLAVYFYQRWRNRRNMMWKIRREWGQEPDQEYSLEAFENITRYYANRKTEGFQIDDITWNDLDMDRVFLCLNHTRSFLGESYLYYQLRTPQMKAEPLEKFERLVSWFQAHTSEREEMEYFFSRLGRSGKSPVFDYVYNLASVNLGSPLIHYAVIGLLAAAVAALLTAPQPGIILLLAALIFSIWTYERYKRPVAPYITSCIALEKILRTAEGILKYDVPGLARDEIRTYVDEFGRLRRNMKLLLAGEGTGLENFLFTYLNNLFHIDLIQFHTVVKEIAKRLSGLEFLVEEMGQVESAIAVASSRALYQEHAVPVLHEEGEIRFRAKDMYHPLISDPVTNSIDTRQCVLLTGSNASGKSTFLKTAALQALLAQTIHTAFAWEYEGRYFRVFSSMALRDDIMSEESYYMVEIRSLKRILDSAQQEPPVFCCVDEVLRGTNTIERVSASSQILKWMAGKNLLCMAATHDIELTWILEDLYRNCHFEEEVTDDEIRFDYRLREGRAMTRNAIRLLGLMGFDETIIRDASQMAERLTARDYAKTMQPGDQSGAPV